MFSKHWIAKNILHLTDEEFLRNQREAFYDRKYQASLDAVTELAAQEIAGGGGLGGELGGAGEELGGGELGDELPAPGDELGGGDLGGAEGGDLGGEAGGEESSLLAAPARREDNPTAQSLEPQSKGKKYYKKKDDT